MTDAGVETRGGARGYSWPPFAVGHEIRLTHGAHSDKRVQPLADQMHATMLRAAPWCASPAFAGTVQSYAWAEGQALLLRRYVDEHGSLDDEGEERPAARMLDRVEGRLAKLRDQLGLTPIALGKLLTSIRDVSGATGDDAGLDAVLAQSASMLAARVAQMVEAGVEAEMAGQRAEGPTDG